MTVPHLDDRLVRIVGLIECGADTAAIADELDLSTGIVRRQILRARAILGCQSMLDLPRAAREAGIDLPECEATWEPDDSVGSSPGA